MAFAPSSFACFGPKGLKTWGLLELHAWGALLPLGALPVDLGVPQGNTLTGSCGGTSASIVPYICEPRGQVCLERCQELKERPSGSTQQRGLTFQKRPLL